MVLANVAWSFAGKKLTLNVLKPQKSPNAKHKMARYAQSV